MNACPFTLNIYAGFGTCEGMLRNEGGYLDVEFPEDVVDERLRGADVRVVRVPLKELVSVTITKGWLGTSWMGVKIVLQAAKMETLKDVPGMIQGKVEFNIARKDRDAAERLVAGLHEETAE